MKIGFIDYYLDEWHANNYPKWISDASKGAMKVTYAYGDIDAPNGMTSDQWCKNYDVTPLPTIKELVEKSDCIVVLSPDNPEQHERLSKIALMSGKRVYIDKTFAENRDEAIRMFELADKYNTPMYSSSALRFSKELENVVKTDIEMVNSRGQGQFDIYSIHQIEPIVSLLGPEAKRIISLGTEKTPTFAIEFSNGRRAIMSSLGWQCPFGMAIYHQAGNVEIYNEFTDYFPRFIDNLVDFFESGDVKVPAKETISIISIRECGLKALANQGTWIDIP